MTIWADPTTIINVELVVAVIVQLAVVFTGMRLFYGCWPWEAEKTWRRLRPKTPASEPGAAEIDEVLALDPSEALAPADDAMTETPSYTFVREELAKTVTAAMRSGEVTVQPLVVGPPMTIQSDRNRHPGFLQSGQLTLFGAAIIVLLVFAWSHAH